MSHAGANARRSEEMARQRSRRAIFTVFSELRRRLPLRRLVLFSRELRHVF